MLRLDTRASRAWVKASIPVSAVIFGGMVAVTAGSHTATSGTISMLPMPCLILVSSSVMTTERLTSLAVPLVDGMHTT